MLAKIVATSLCRGAGLVGGIYAPSILIGGLAGYSFATGAGALLHAAGINWVVSQQVYPPPPSPACVCTRPCVASHDDAPLKFESEYAYNSICIPQIS